MRRPRLLRMNKTWVTHKTRKRRAGVSTVIGSLIFILILVAGLTTIMTVFGYFNTYNSQLLQYNQSALQRQETSLSINSFSFGSSPTTVGTSASSTTASVPITITNSQSSATPSTFQQKIVFNPSTYSSYEASNLGNIRFCLDSACNTQLYSWLESCSPSCSTSATSATAWVQLTSSISASGGTLTIYMVFQSSSTNFDGNYWGEAPTLSGTYGQYDNGANVFTFYDNFAGTFLSGKWSSITHFGSYSVNNGITISTSRSSGYSYVYSASQSQPQVAEAYMVSVSGDSPILGVETQSNNNGYGMYNGYSLNWYSSRDSFCPENSGGTGTCSTRSVASFPAGIWSVYWGARGVEGSTDGLGNTITSSDNSLGAIANYGIYIGAASVSSGSSVVQWARMRSYPPNNVMPSTSFGAVSPPVGTANGYSFQDKLEYSQGFWWIFYSDGTNIVYVSSPDGTTWTTPTTVTSSPDATNGYDFSIWVSGTTIYYILTSKGVSSSFLWRYGTLQSTGTIGWSIAETSVSTTNVVYSCDSIITDSSGNVWASVSTSGGFNTHIEVWKYSASAWSKIDDLSTFPADEVSILEPLTSGVALIYGEGGVTAPVNIITSATGSSWTSPVSPASDYLLDSSAATEISNTVYFVGLASPSAGVTTGTVNIWSFAYGSSSTSLETKLQGTSSTWSASISSEPSKTLLIFYGAGTSLYALSSLNFGVSWSATSTVSSSETSATEIIAGDGGDGVMWLSGSSSPYNVRFASYSLLETVNSSPFAVHMISLYILNTASESLVHFDANSSATGVSGLFDQEIGAGEMMTVPIGTFSWTTSQSYLVTVATDQGNIFSTAVTSPS